MTGDTWGIGGPVFLVLYLVLAGVLGAHTARTRRALVGGPVAGGGAAGVA